MIGQGTLEGRERAVAPLVQNTPAHTEACRDLGNRLATEQREDGLEPVFPSGACGLWGGLHTILLLIGPIMTSPSSDTMLIS